jgi:hypothetical protein
MGKLHVLHGGGGVAVAELSLGGARIAGLLDEMHTHGISWVQLLLDRSENRQGKEK